MPELTPEAAAAAMVQLGWEPVDLSPDDLFPLTGVYESSFGITALVVAASTFKTPGAWARYQAAFADLVSEGRVPPEKDRYLVFLVPEIGKGEVPEIESALANTHLARKICLDARGRTAEDVLAESILLAGPRIVSEAETDLGSTVIPASILDDLGTRAAGVVLDRLIAGDYEEDDR